MKIRSYWLGLLTISTLLIVVVLVLNQTELSEYYQAIHPWIPVIFLILTGAEHTILLKTIIKNPNRFSQAFMAASSIKLLLILLVTVIYLLIDKSQVIPFVIILFVNYIVFTVFEVRALLKLVKRSS
jgi:hypothetical protein